jgi:hypothetical protein
VSAWVQVPAGVQVNLRTRELQGTSVVARHTFAVTGSSGTWVQLSGPAPIVNGGDALQLLIFARLAAGQSLLVDGVVESCH